MRVRVDRFFDFFFQRTSLFEEYDILRKLPSGIRRKVVMHINKKLVQKFWRFFGNVKNELRCALLIALKVIGKKITMIEFGTTHFEHY